MTLKEIAAIGGFTFVVVGSIALMLLPKESAQARQTAAVVAVSAEPLQRQGSTPPALIALGAPPPDGVEIDSEYKRRQVAAFLTAHSGQPLEVIEAVEISGSQRTEYCGTARPITGGAPRSWSIVLWSDAPIEHTISNEPADCSSGLTLVRNGRAVAWEDAYAEQQARLESHAPSLTEPPAEPAASGSGSMHDHIDRVSTYAVLIGRGAACGIDTRDPAGRVGVWLDRVAPPGSAGQQTLLPMFMQQSQYHAQRQAAGRSPDDCATVARAIRSHPWP